MEITLRSGKSGRGQRETATRSSLELQDGLDATRAECGMRGVLAEVGFPMPAALTFLAVGFGNLI